MCLTAQEKIRNRINIKNKTAGHAGIACFSFALKGNRAGSPHFKIVRFMGWKHVTGYPKGEIVIYLITVTQWIAIPAAKKYITTKMAHTPNITKT